MCKSLYYTKPSSTTIVKGGLFVKNSFSNRDAVGKNRRGNQIFNLKHNLVYFRLVILLSFTINLVRDTV